MGILASPFDDDLNLLWVARVIEAWLQLDLCAVDLCFLLQDLLEALQLLDVAVIHLKRGFCGLVDVLNLRRLPQNDFVAATLEQRIEWFTPSTLEGKLQLHLWCSVGMPEDGHDAVYTP